MAFCFGLPIGRVGENIVSGVGLVIDSVGIWPGIEGSACGYCFLQSTPWVCAHSRSTAALVPSLLLGSVRK